MTIIVGITVFLPPLRSQDTGRETEELREEFEIFPSVFWYSIDGWLKSLGPDGGGADDLVKFLREYEVADFEVKTFKPNPIVTLSLKKKVGEDEYWTFRFKKVKDQWKAVDGWRIDGKSRTNLFEGSIFEPLPMRGFVEKEMKASLKKEGVYADDYIIPSTIKIAPTIDVPIYKSLVGGRGRGAGFHFELKGKRFIASSKHQFGNRSPSTFVTADLENDIVIKKTVFEGLDCYVFEYDLNSLKGVKPLKLKNNGSLKVGHPVYVDDVSGWVLGHITVTNSAAFSVAMTKPIAPAGMSGSAIIDGKTGEAIGLLFSAEDPKKALSVMAYYFGFPESLTRDVVIEERIQKAFGITASSPLSEEFSRKLQETLFHPDFFKVELDMQKKELMDIFPELIPTNLTGRPGPQYTYDFISFEVDRSGVNFINFGNIANKKLSYDDLESTFKFLVHFLGNPTTLIQRDLDLKKAGDEILLLIWEGESYTAGWVLDEDKSQQYGTNFMLFRGKKEHDDFLYLKNSREIEGSDQMKQKLFKKWAKFYEQEKQ